MEIDCIVFTLNPLRGKCSDMSEGGKRGNEENWNLGEKIKGECRQWEKEKEEGR